MNQKGGINVETVGDAEGRISSPFSNELGEIYFACENGKILKYKDGEIKVDEW